MDETNLKTEDEALKDCGTIRCPYPCEKCPYFCNIEEREAWIK